MPMISPQQMILQNRPEGCHIVMNICDDSENHETTPFTGPDLSRDYTK